jgi:putative RecB family exonuclease
MSQFDVASVFAEELDKAVQEESRHFPVTEWFPSGPRDGQQAVEWWHEHGPAMVHNFTDWYESQPDVHVWITPDGIPAIELPIEVMFGSIPVRMVLDVVFQIGTALVVCDLKTSAKAPDSNRQLAIYACGIELKYGIRPRYGTYFMCRGQGRSEPKTYFLRPVQLDRPQYSVPYLTSQFEAVECGIRTEVFPAKPGEQCDRCGVAWACTETGGNPEARKGIK